MLWLQIGWRLHAMCALSEITNRSFTAPQLDRRGVLEHCPDAASFFMRTSPASGLTDLLHYGFDIVVVLTGFSVLDDDPSIGMESPHF